METTSTDGRLFNTSFVRSFKTGDNIALNVESIALMHRIRAELPEHEAWKLNKSIVIAAASIIEACLFELVQRARFNTREGIPNISQKHLDAIRKTKKDGLQFCVAIAREMKFLGPASGEIYNDLNDLVKLRDRIHIQNKWKHSPKCEKLAFNSESVLVAERCLEKVLVCLSRKYPRNMCYTPPLHLPWNYGEDI